MNTLQRLFLILILVCGFAGPATAAGKSAPAKNRLVVQVSEDDTKKWNALFGSLHNIRAELGKEDIRIVVVAIGPGLGLLTADSLVANRVEDARAEGVEFVACGNSMQAQQIAKDDLVAGVRITKAGYVEILRLQQQGWVYIRP